MPLKQPEHSAHNRSPQLHRRNRSRLGLARPSQQRQRLREQNQGVATDKSIEIGDVVGVRYLTDDKKTVRITISKTLSDPDNGVIHFQSPIAKALLGAEEGDEVDVLVGSYVRPAVVESIFKNQN
jgi:transcription elongation GreA/GreB family factor